MNAAKYSYIRKYNHQAAKVQEHDFYRRNKALHPYIAQLAGNILVDICKMLQNQAIIFDNHSITQGSGSSIISSRQSTCLSDFAEKLDFSSIDKSDTFEAVNNSHFKLLAPGLAATKRKTVVHSQRRHLWHTRILALACRTPAKSRSL